MARMGAAAAAAQPLAPPGADAAAQARYRAGSEEVRPIRSARDAASLDGAAAGRRALAALERLGDTDTLAQGRSELRSIARLCPPQAVAGLLEALFAALRRPSAQEAGPAVRAAAVGAFAALARTKGRALAAHVPRLVAHLLRHFKGTVRGSTRSGSAEQRDPVSDACADAFAALAASGAAGSSAGELEALWRPLIEAMHDSDPAIQATACHCLTAMIGATVSDSARRSSATAAFPKLLRHVERPVFGARREALDALGALLALGAEAQAHAGTLLRLAEQALADPKDFAARRSGAQLIVDMASSLSHDLLRYASQARSALEGARYDRVASVRSAVAEATRAVERLVGVDGGDDGDDSRGGLSSRGRRARSALQMKPNDAFFHKRDVPLVVSALPPEREISEGPVIGNALEPELVLGEDVRADVSTEAVNELEVAAKPDERDASPEPEPEPEPEPQPQPQPQPEPEAPPAPALRMDGLSQSDATDILVELRRLAAQQDELLQMVA